MIKPRMLLLPRLEAEYWVLPSLCTRLGSAICWIVLGASAVLAQGPGGGGGGQPGTPMFEEPKFRDKVWEAGGPRLDGLHNGKMVLGVDIVGNQSVSKHKILSHMQTRKDRSYDEKQLQMDIRELYRTDLIRLIVPEIVEYPQGVVVRLKVTEQPLVKEVIFHGNTRLEDKFLLKHCGINPGDPINPFSVEMAQQRLLDLYHEKGMNQAAIQVVEGNKASDRRVFFEISEGPLERIVSIDFVGNTLFTTAVLKTKISCRDARGGVTRYAGNVASKLKIEDDTRMLVAFYRSLGYFNARADYRIKYHENGESMDLTFVLDEGQPFSIRDISIVGNRFPAFTNELLLSSMELKPGDMFNLGKMNRDQRSLRLDYYGREGFAFAEIVPQLVWLDEPNVLDIVYTINEGDQFVVGDINVHLEGDSSHTRHSVLINMLGLREGQLVDLRELENTERRMRFSNLFENNPAQAEPPRVELRRPDQDDDF